MNTQHGSNRAFLIAAIGMGLMLLLVTGAFIVWALILNPQMQARQAETNAAIFATNEALLVSQSATATALAAAPPGSLTATPVPDLPLACPTVTMIDCPRCDVLQPGYTLQTERCTTEACILTRDSEPDYPIGVATLEGYYTPRERSNLFGEPGVVTCDAFVITGGSEMLMRAYLTLVEKGNTVNTRNALNQPIINLDFSTLTEAEVAQIVESTPEKPLTLVVLSSSPLYTSVPACFSPVEVLRVR